MPLPTSSPCPKNLLISDGRPITCQYLIRSAAHTDPKYRSPHTTLLPCKPLHKHHGSTDHRSTRFTLRLRLHQCQILSLTDWPGATNFCNIKDWASAVVNNILVICVVDRIIFMSANLGSKVRPWPRKKWYPCTRKILWPPPYNLEKLELTAAWILH